MACGGLCAGAVWRWSCKPPQAGGEVPSAEGSRPNDSTVGLSVRLVLWHHVKPPAPTGKTGCTTRFRSLPSSDSMFVQEPIAPA